MKTNHCLSSKFLSFGGGDEHQASVSYDDDVNGHKVHKNQSVVVVQHRMKENGDSTSSSSLPHTLSIQEEEEEIEEDYDSFPFHFVMQSDSMSMVMDSPPPFDTHLTSTTTSFQEPTTSSSISSSSSPTSTNNNNTTKRAYIRKSVNTRCVNCSTCTTPMWRKNHEGKPLCNKCGLYALRYGIDRPLVPTLKSGRKRKLSEEGTKSFVSSHHHGENSEDFLLDDSNKKKKKKKQHGRRMDEHSVCLHSNFIPTTNSQQLSSSSVTSTTTTTSITSSSSNKDQNSKHHKAEEAIVVGGWSSLSELKDRLKEASERYPDIIHTMISIIRKLVVTQPQVESQLLQKQLAFHGNLENNHQACEPYMQDAFQENCCFLEMNSLK
ncbi:hypothetical protein FDP41_007619 [Naegleria fowleri]|uniref:GATA-type domain-containing protein n=1 Tax=Naegleria fowleri TaxID=5763 RepID=A0A6A5CAW6_NAEFO|nr:uncharacterized protein FDP41_007619 [Naegleria fowleri]KAF0983704.1 hypothetical protein FDP41_007619 [Naegleria fowleri]CAG4710879.1 unnamed protein product [Naegleria fowleri]